jgi:hypothetical protein
MHSAWFNGIDILQGRWQHGEKMGYCYPSGLEKTLCKWEVYVPLVTKGLIINRFKDPLYVMATYCTDSKQWHINYTSPALVRSEAA